MMMIRPISGYGDKSPAAFLVETHGRRLLLDLGAEAGVWPDLSMVGAVDAVLLSHGHGDHIGGLDRLADIGTPPVYATAVTAALHPNAPISGVLPLAGATDILGVPVETGRASHAPGGIWLRLGGAAGVLYTGDWTVESALYPLDPMPPAARLICDCSYGLYDAPLVDGAAALATLVAAGPVLLPMPPTGRGLEAALYFHRRGVPVALCPDHRRVAEILVGRHPEAVTADGVAPLRALLAATTPLSADTPAAGVMIAASATADGGLARPLAERFRASGEASIVLTGHVPAGTLAADLRDAGIARRVRWNVHPRLRDVRALVDHVRPRQFLPAFIGGDALAALHALAPDTP